MGMWEYSAVVVKDISCEREVTGSNLAVLGAVVARKNCYFFGVSLFTEELLCRVSTHIAKVLPTARQKTLDKDLISLFMEELLCRMSTSTRQRFCRVHDKKHSTKMFLLINLVMWSLSLLGKAFAMVFFFALQCVCAIWQTTIIQLWHTGSSFIDRNMATSLYWRYTINTHQLQAWH